MKRKSLFLIMPALLALAACKPDTPKQSTEVPSSSVPGDYHYVPQDISARDVNVPTTVPDFGEPSIQIHYRRESNSYAGWGLWLWDPAGDDDGEVDTFNYQDDFGVTAAYPISKFGACSERRIGFIIRKLDSWTKDGDADRFILLDVVREDAKQIRHVYIFSGDMNIYSSPNKELADRIDLAQFASDRLINVKVSNAPKAYKLYKNGELVLEKNVSQKRFDIEFPENMESAVLTDVYEVEVEFLNSGGKIKTTVSVAGLYNTEDFNERYTYDGELGAIYSEESTTFRVWTPVSSAVELRIYSSGTPKALKASGDDTYQAYPMTLGEHGVYEATVQGDLEGKYYTYAVTNSRFKGKEVVDPYAKSAGANGLRGMIVDFSKTNPDGWDEADPYQINRNALTVWETHVADVTSSPNWKGTESNRLKFAGMYEAGTVLSLDGTDYKTGFDHIKELGVNAVQLIPIFDQANDELNMFKTEGGKQVYKFNWGYNPLNYNVVEGCYSSDPEDGYARIREFKTLVNEYHKAGINIIMDVVYNHVNGADGSNFDVLMPNYYYRYNADGTLSNGSGCGNETASEMPMMRKFMIDSVCFWADEYKLGGFRFDLMGLHDVKTMNALTREAKKVNPGIVIYGEPWAGGTSAMPDYETNSAKQSNGNKYVGYGQFNDMMRDALIKGGLNSTSAKGWITDESGVNAGDVTAIKKGIAGSTYSSSYEIADPNKTVNYVTCHDNYTLVDRIKLATGYEAPTSKGVANNVARQMATLANAIIFTSQGTSFMLAGEEMLRSKNGDGNSYESSNDINMLRYYLKNRNADTFEIYQKLIAFKQEAEGLHSDTCSLNVESLSGGSVLKYAVPSGDKEYMVIHSNGAGTKQAIDLTGYSVYLDTLGELSGALGSVTPKAFQTIIAVKD